MSDPSTDELAALLHEFKPKPKPVQRSAHDERVITGFQEIQDFISQHGREPSRNPDGDILERILATRLASLRTKAELHALLAPFDTDALLATTADTVDPAELTPDELLASLTDGEPDTGITRLEHVRSIQSRQAPDEIAARKPAADFHLYRDMFKQVQAELKSGRRNTKRFESTSEVIPGSLLIVEGQTAFIAEVGEAFINENGRRDARLRVVYDNGTESNLLLRSLQKAVTLDPNGRVILDSANQPLFTGTVTEEDQASGTIYVLRTLSDHPAIAPHRTVLHKIGVTSGDVKRRIANARKDPTFLMADVEVVATYELYNINRHALEQVLHRVFAPARLRLDIKDRFAVPINPREWFLVPAFVVQEAVERIKDGSITVYYYDPVAVELRRFG